MRGNIKDKSVIPIFLGEYLSKQIFNAYFRTQLNWFSWEWE